MVKPPCSFVKHGFHHVKSLHKLQQIAVSPCQKWQGASDGRHQGAQDHEEIAHLSVDQTWYFDIHHRGQLTGALQGF